MKKIKSFLVLGLFMPSFVHATEYVICGQDMKFPSAVVNIVSSLLIIIKIFVPIALVISGMVSFFKVTFSSNVDDELAKSKSKLIRNVIAAVVIFFTMSIINFLLKFVNVSGSIGECFNCFVNPDQCNKVEVASKLCTGLISEQDKYDENCKLKEPLSIDTDPVADTSKSIRGTKGGSKVSGSRSSGEWANWTQWDSRWGSTRLGNSSGTLASVGCTTTSIAILMAKSHTKLTVSDFTPATLARVNNFGPGGGISSWTGFVGIAPNFQFVGDTGQGRNGLGSTKAEKAQKIKSFLDKGYYVIITVKPGEGHWVAVDYVDGNDVYIIDPASTSYRNLFSSYNYMNVTRAVFFENRG